MDEKLDEQYILAINYATNGNYSEALGLFEYVKEYIPIAQIDIIRCYFSMNQEEKGFKYISSLIDNKNTLNNISLNIKAVLQFILGEHSFNSFNYKKALEHYMIALSLNLKANNQIDECFEKMNNYKKAKLYYEKTIKNNENGILHNIGNIFYKLKDYELAIEYYLESNRKGCFISNLGIGNCYYSKGKYEKAFEYYKKILDNKDYVQIDPLILGKLYFNIANSFLNNNNLPEAKKYYEFALNSNCESAKNNLKLFYSIDKNNKYNVNIDDVYMVKSLISLKNNNLIENTNNNLIENANNNLIENTKKKVKYF